MSNTNSVRRKLGVALRIALAWLPLFLLWALFILSYAQDPGLAGAVLGAGTNVGWAALLGVAVWVLTARLQWPDDLSARFYGAHLGAGAVYSSVWLIGTYTVGALRDGRSVMSALQASPVLGWQFIQGLVLYGLVAGVSYAVRTRRSLREQELVAARARASAAQARLEALRGRLHPHFLFNCLHSLSELVRENPAEAGTAVERLGELLRYALDESAEDTVPLSEEWQFTRNYLGLEDLCYDGRLRVESRLAPDALAGRVPPFTLQLLVENAVRHAIAPRPEGGTIRIHARRDGERLTLSVSDDGPGIDGRALDSSSGMGLYAIRERLDHIYRGEADLRLSTSRDEGLEVTVSLPAEVPEPLTREPE